MTDHPKGRGKQLDHHKQSKIVWKIVTGGTLELTNWAVNWEQLTISAPWSEQSTSRTDSSLRELWNGVWSQHPQLRDQKLWVVPHQGPHPQFLKLPGWEWMNEPPAWERGDPAGWESPKQSLTPELPKQSGGKAYRRRLGHVCTMESSPNGSGWVRENHKGHCEVSRDANKSTWAQPNFLQICSITSVWSFHSHFFLLITSTSSEEER